MNDNIISSREQFEAGRWYRDIGERIDYHIYIKYLNSHPTNNKYIYSSEAIVNGSHRYKYEEFWLLGGVRNWVLVETSEVSEHLPDGHPDKLVETKDIPEYVECVNGFDWGESVKKGVIYDTKVEIPGTKSTWELRLKVWPEDFKPSTKEAFEKQNNKQMPEYVECVNSKGWGSILKEGVIYDTKVDIPGTNHTWESRLRDYPNDFKPSTKEAFEKQNNKTVMSKQKLTVPVTDVLKIHSIACATWKGKIASDYLPRVNSDQNIKFSQTEVNSMFAVATASQLSVLEEVFGKQSKPIDWDKIKTGSQVMIKYSDEHCGGIDAIDKSKPVTVIFFNTPYMITSNGRFLPNGAHPKYCTFEQNGKFTLFSASEDTYENYIVDVIRY